MVHLLGSAGPLPWWRWVSSHLGVIASALGQHAELTAIAVGVGLVIALPLAIAAWKVRVLRPPFLAVTGALYVIPSIALFALAGPVTGYFSITTAEVALVGYTLLILLRNTIAGLDAVPADAREAARGMGYTQLAHKRRDSARPRPGDHRRQRNDARYNRRATARRLIFRESAT